MLRTLILMVFIASMPFSITCADSSDLFRIEPSEWKYGMISQGEITTTEVTVTNTSLKPSTVRFISTCSCLSVEPESITLAPGAEGRFLLTYDSKDDSGKVYRSFIVETDPPGPKPFQYLLGGVVRVDRIPSSDIAGVPGSATGSSQNGEASSASGLGTGNGIPLVYYSIPGCRSCETFISTELPKLQAHYGITVDLIRRNLLEPAVYEELVTFAASTGARLTTVPALRVGNQLLQGESEIEDNLGGLLMVQSSVIQSAEAEAPIDTPNAPGVDLGILPVMLAGLIDGINPCVFTTLIFLMASLALAGKGKREILVIGSFFASGVFLTYFGTGLGLFSAIRALGNFPLASTILRWALVALLVVLAGLSIIDYTRIRAGKTSQMILQLPLAVKQRIHASIRTQARTTALAGSSLVLGFIVSILEFACTGQVYLPTLTWLAGTERGFRALSLLLLYNLCFILPLLIIFAASYFGVSSKRLAGIFSRSAGFVKLGLALVFILLAVLTILT